ncbi:hypothetical protein [Sphingobacterium sp. CZ-2]|uniref:hypothetical protein n=1 Tax=Sphingobacterium sp. CZ-2 TaxID=2557994 RepID=UPI001070477E|nr:hypothetical protein [Sphingobacterium sp. CZ-2]QBR10665.1 hypothetical protein E3D81_00105 [Sphingobacterium sp. CZ-2]
MTLNLIKNISCISIYNVTNNILKVKGKKRYILRNIRRRKCRIREVGRPIELTPEQAKENQKQANKNWKKLTTALKNCNSLEQKENLSNGIIDTITFKPKPSNKMLSYWLMNMYSMFDFDYFLTLNHTDKYILNKFEAKKTKTFDEYFYNIQQDKYVKQANVSLESLTEKVNDYIDYIKKENKIKIHYYIVRYEKNLKNNWHAHLALKLDKPNALNIHNYLNNRWLYSKFRKKTVKKIGNTKLQPKHQQIRNVLSYMFKKLDHYNSNVIEYEVYGINANTPISFIVKKDNRANYDMRMFEQFLNLPLAS